MNKKDCLFCKIAKGEIKSDVVYKDGQVIVFKDIHPQAPIHLLIIPKVHIQSVAHLQKKQSKIVSSLVYVAKKIAGTKKITGYKLVFNVGREGGQVIDHLHLHLLGGWSSADNNKYIKY